MKNLKPLSKAEMKKVVGGEDPLCPAGMCYDPALNQCFPDGDCGVECGPNKAFMYI